MITDTKPLEHTSDISQLIAQQLMVHKSSIFPFADSNAFIAELLRDAETTQRRCIAVGVATPELMIACDKAGLELTEVLGKSAFTNSIETILDAIQDGDIVYLQNPHKLNGTNFSKKDITSIIEHNKNGLNIIDEYYFDFFGISALPLLTLYDNIVILRSFAAAFGIYSSDAGYAISTKKRVDRFEEHFHLRPVRTILRKTIIATLTNNDALQERLKDIHDESLRITKTLTELGVQCRITATDFLLLRVASVKDVGNRLAKAKIQVDNLDGFPKMQNYIRYRIESKFSNDRLIEAFEKMPEEMYKLKSIDLQKTILRKPETTNKLSLDEVLESKVAERTKTAQEVEEKHLFKILD